VVIFNTRERLHRWYFYNITPYWSSHFPFVSDGHKTFLCCRRVIFFCFRQNSKKGSISITFIVIQNFKILYRVRLQYVQLH
jgi:hypothetical protein